MSLQTKPSPEATPRPGISSPVRKSAAAPVFKPEFQRSVRMHPLVAAAVACVVFAAIVAYALSQKPMYEAEALVYVEPAASKVLEDGTGGQFDANKYDSYLQQEMQTAQRLDILKAAVHSLPVGVWRGRSESEQQAALRLQQSLKVERVLNSYQLSFTLKGATAQGTADSLNAVIAAFLAAGRQNELSIAGERVQILTEERNRISAELTTARTEQATLSSSLGMANPGLDSDNPYDAQLVGLRTQLGEAREAHDIAAAQLASVSGTDPARTQGLTAAADELIAGDAGLSSMKATISQRRAVLSGQMAGLTPENPIYKQDQTEIADLHRTLESMTTQMRDKAERRLQDKLRTDLARTGDVEARLNAQLAGQTYAATNAAPKLQRAAELTADIQRLMKRYATVDDSLRSVQLETSGPGMAHLALPAATPVYPMPNRRKLMLLAALPIGLLCGAFAAVFLRKRDPHVYTGRDLEELLGFTPIAVLPAPDDVPDGVMHEYVLRLAGGIESAYRTAGARSFVLTPAGTSVSSETLTLPLASMLRQLGLRVATTTARRLMELVQDGESSLGAETHGGGLVDARLDALKAADDLVFIESPALLTSAETEYLVRCADATILIATSGVTRRGELLQATLLLERMGVKGVGAVLEGLHLRYADAAYRLVIAQLDRRQSFEDRTVQTSQPRLPEEPVASQEPLPAVPFAGATAMAATEGALPVEPSAGMEGQTVPLSAREPAGLVEISAPAPPAIGEMMEPSTQEPAVAAAPEIETPTAPAQATEEPLPMAMQFLKLEQPDQPVQATASAIERGDEMEPAQRASVVSEQPVQSVQSTHRRVPVRRVQPEPEPARNWFQRIFQRDGEPVVSIIPDHDDENDEGQQEQVGSYAPAVSSVPLHAREDLDLPPRMEAATVFAAEPAPAAVASAPEPEPPMAAAPPQPVPQAAILEERFAAPLAWQQHPAEAGDAAPAAVSPAATGLEPAHLPATVAPPPMMPEAASEGEPVAHGFVDVEYAGPIALEPVFQSRAQPVAEPVSQPAAESVCEPARQPVAVAAPELRPAAPTHEPAFTAMKAEARPSALTQAAPLAQPEQAALPRPVARLEPAAQPQPFAASEPIAQPQPQAASEPFRTGRWEPARQTSRSETTPWRDRRVSGPNAVYRAPERRFNWNTEAAKPLSLVPNPSAEPGRTGPKPPAASAPPAPPARLTRQWGLLSRFENPSAAADGSREQERNAEQAGGTRGYRRG